MPIDPQIARGYQGGTVNAFFDGEKHRARMDEYKSMDARRNALVDIERQQLQQQQGDAAQQSDLLNKWAEIEQYAEAPPEIKAQYVEIQKAKHPEFNQTPLAQMPPEQAFDAMRNGLAARMGKTTEKPEKAPGPISYEKTPWGGQIAMQDGKKIADYNPSAPQQYGPESFSTFTDAQGKVWQTGNRGTIRPTNLSGPTKAAGGTGVTVGPDGQLTVDSASIKASEGERKVAALGVRLEASLRNLETIRARNPGSDRPTYEEVAKGGVPIVGEMWANKSRSPDRQQADAAQTDALDAALTLATGAAYTKEQFAGLKKAYFPQIGDSEETVKFKEQQFNNIVQAARVNAGRAEPTINAALDASGQTAATKTTPENRVPRVEAPPEAVAYLKQHPETKAAFFKKYGYLPRGK